MMTKSIFKVIAIVVLLYTSIAKGQINPANNIISVDVSTFPQYPGFNYDSCFALGVNLGMTQVGIFQNWTAIETAPLTYDLTIMDIANIYYPAHNIPVDLTIAPIHTNRLEVPSDLTNVPFNSPTMISRFKALLDSIQAHSPNLVLSSLIIGSEHDAYMGANMTLWAQYTTFYDSVSSYAKTIWPGLKVATELTFTGITTMNTFAQTLNTNSDYIGVSYYPLNNNFTVKQVSTIPADFAALISLYPSKPICFYQYGYPSGTSCNSSENLQKQFITQTFTTWDTYASNIRMIDFTWLHDLDTATVNFYGTYYGITDTIFLEYLRTLGLRKWNGSGIDKPAFTELQCQARQRGYNNLNINCTPTGIKDLSSKENNIISIFPNPAQNELNIEMSFELENTEIRIYNCLGQIVKMFSKTNDKNISIETANLSNGVYFIVIQKDGRQLNQKFIINK